MASARTTLGAFGKSNCAGVRVALLVSGTLTDPFGFRSGGNQRPRGRAGIMSCLIGDREGFEIGDFRFAPVTGANPFQPWPIIESLRCGKVLPDVRTACHAAVHIVDEL